LFGCPTPPKVVTPGIASAGYPGEKTDAKPSGQDIPVPAEIPAPDPVILETPVVRFLMMSSPNGRSGRDTG